MDIYIKRVENLIRVLHNVEDKDFDLGNWWNKESMCGCAAGWATQDAYFINQGFIYTITGVTYQNTVGMRAVGDFFDIQSANRLQDLFTFTGYKCANFSKVSCRKQVIQKLQVLLMEKQAVHGLENAVSQSKSIAPEMVAELVD